MAKQNYSDKLNDPRWQKKRLEMFEKYDWRCYQCDENTEQLHLHHLVYFPHRDPWDYPDICYLVLCKSCHEKYRDDILECGTSILDDIPHLIVLLEDVVMDLEGINCVLRGLDGFRNVCPRLLPPTYSAVLEWSLSDRTMVSLMVEGYLEHLDRTNRKKLADLERKVMCS